MKKHFKFRYPKLFVLLLVSCLSYYLFAYTNLGTWVAALGETSYVGMFIAGLLFSFGFSTPLAIGFFLTAQPQNIALAALIGAIGALISDLIIFKMIRFSFMDEFIRLEKTRPLQAIIKTFSHKPFAHMKMYLLYVCAGIIIASPLPDELGVSMLAGLTSIKTRTFALISFIMNTIGITLMLLAARAFT